MKRGLLAVLLLAAAAVFAALGAWQVERRAEKLELIAAVERRAYAAPIPAPGPAAWAGLSAQADAYTRVQVHGTWLPGQDSLVQAVTGLGAGYWVLAPLQTDAGWTVLVNRGFIPMDRPALAAPPAAATVTGLLRVSEPGGAFLRSNDPAAGRWFSRDVAAIGQAHGLETAPYFIDADAAPNPGGYPVGGLTVIAFPNSHAAYAFTWFALAGLSLAGLRVMRRMDAARQP